MTLTSKFMRHNARYTVSSSGGGWDTWLRVAQETGDTQPVWSADTRLKMHQARLKD